MGFSSNQIQQGIYLMVGEIIERCEEGKGEIKGVNGQKGKMSSVSLGISNAVGSQEIESGILLRFGFDRLERRPRRKIRGRCERSERDLLRQSRREREKRERERESHTHMAF